MFFFENHGIEEKDLFHINRLHSQTFPAHLHRAYELIVVDEGTLALQVEQKQYLLAKGDAAFIFCNQIHSFSASEKSEIFIILFSPELIGDFYSAHKGRVPDNNVVRLKKTVDFCALKSVYAQKSWLYHVCDELLSGTNMEPVSNRSQIVALQQVFAYVDNHFGGDCSLKTVAGALQYDYAYLSKLFTQMAGMHFTEYLNNYRVAQACYMLKAGKHTVSETAANCGYSTLRTFHRNFRMVLHCSPREYLAKNLEYGESTLK